MKPLLLVLTNIQNAKARSMVKMVLEGAGHRVIEAAGFAQAQALLSNGLDPDLFLCEPSHICAPGTPRFLQVLNFAGIDRVCLITKLSERQLREEAGRLGVERTLTMPLTREDVERMVESLTVAKGTAGPVRKSASPCADLEITSHNAAPSAPIPEDMPAVPYLEELSGSNFFLAASPQMLEIHRQVKLLADLDVNVLILGESGTGKEVIAQLIHRNSGRSREKFLKVNCAALPADTQLLCVPAPSMSNSNVGRLLIEAAGAIVAQIEAGAEADEIAGLWHLPYEVSEVTSTSSWTWS